LTQSVPVKDLRENAPLCISAGDIYKSVSDTTMTAVLIELLNRLTSVYVKCNLESYGRLVDLNTGAKSARLPGQ
jgi:hypothetical protein